MAEAPPGNLEKESLTDEQAIAAMKEGNFGVVTEWYTQQQEITEQFGAGPRLDLCIKLAQLQIEAGLFDFARETLYGLFVAGATMTQEQDEWVAQLFATLDANIPAESISDTEARDALASGDNVKYLTWIDQQKIAIDSQDSDSILNFSLQVRIAMAHDHASRMAGSAVRKSHHAEALKILQDTNASIKLELDDLNLALPNNPVRAARIEELGKLKKNVVSLQTEIERQQ